MLWSPMDATISRYTTVITKRRGGHQTLPIAFSMSLASTIEQGGGDRALIDKALYRRAGYPVAIPANQSGKVTTQSVLSVQNRGADAEVNTEEGGKTVTQ
jgi:L,D-transpeptidase YnhG